MCIKTLLNTLFAHRLHMAFPTPYHTEQTDWVSSGTWGKEYNSKFKTCSCKHIISHINATERLSINVSACLINHTCNYMCLYKCLYACIKLSLLVLDVAVSQYEGHRSLMHQGQAFKSGPSDPVQKLQISLTWLCMTQRVCPDCHRV